MCSGSRLVIKIRPPAISLFHALRQTRRTDQANKDERCQHADGAGDLCERRELLERHWRENSRARPPYESKFLASDALQFFEIALVLVRLGHVASFIVDADHGIV